MLGESRRALARVIHGPIGVSRRQPRLPLVKRGPDLRRRIRGGFPRAAAYPIIGRDLYGSHPCPGNDPSSYRGPIPPRLSHATRVEDRWLGWTRFSGLLPGRKLYGEKNPREKRSSESFEIARIFSYLSSSLWILENLLATRVLRGHVFLSFFFIFFFIIVANSDDTRYFSTQQR